MLLFDELARTELRSARYSESRFNYYNQSARPSIAVLREMLEAWFERYPEDKKASLRGRFRSENDSQHKSAFFELYVHELLVRLDFDVEAEPDLADSGTHPDFLAYRSGTPKFYVEATLAGLPTQSEYSADRRKAAVQDVINSINSPNFFLGIDIQGAPTSPPPTKKLRQTGLALLTLIRLESSIKMNGIVKFLYGSGVARDGG
jgi:hypothetical protein